MADETVPRSAVIRPRRARHPRLGQTTYEARERTGVQGDSEGIRQVYPEFSNRELRLLKSKGAVKYRLSSFEEKPPEKENKESDGVGNLSKHEAVVQSQVEPNIDADQSTGADKPTTTTNFMRHIRRKPKSQHNEATGDQKIRRLKTISADAAVIRNKLTLTGSKPDPLGLNLLLSSEESCDSDKPDGQENNKDEEEDIKTKGRKRSSSYSDRHDFIHTQGTSKDYSQNHMQESSGTSRKSWEISECVQNTENSSSDISTSEPQSKDPHASTAVKSNITENHNQQDLPSPVTPTPKTSLDTYKAWEKVVVLEETVDNIWSETSRLVQAEKGNFSKDPSPVRDANRKDIWSAVKHLENRIELVHERLDQIHKAKSEGHKSSSPNKATKNATDISPSQEMVQHKSQITMLSKRRQEDIERLKHELRQAEQAKTGLDHFCTSLWEENNMLKKLSRKRNRAQENLIQELQEMQEIEFQQGYNANSGQPDVTDWKVNIMRDIEDKLHDIAQVEAGIDYAQQEKGPTQFPERSQAEKETIENLKEQNNVLLAQKAWFTEELGKVKVLLDKAYEDSTDTGEVFLTDSRADLFLCVPHNNSSLRSSRSSLFNSPRASFSDSLDRNMFRRRSVRDRVSTLERRIDAHKKRHSMDEEQLKKCLSGGIMSPEHRRNLLKARLTLLDEMEVSPVLDRLKQTGVITMEMCDDVMQHRSNRTRRSAMLDLLPKEGDLAYDALLKALEETDQKWLSELITQQ